MYLEGRDDIMHEYVLGDIKTAHNYGRLYARHPYEQLLIQLVRAPADFPGKLHELSWNAL